MKSRHGRGLRWWNLLMVLVIGVVICFTFFSFLYFFRWRNKKIVFREWDRLGCIPNFRPIEFVKSRGSKGFLFDSYIVHRKKELIVFTVPVELTKRSHFKTKFPLPPEILRIRLIHYDNSTGMKSESKTISSEVVMCERKVCAYSNHEYFKGMAYTHVYSCKIPKSFEMDEKIEGGLHFTIHQDKNKENIYYAPDCSNEPSYEYSASTLVKNERKNIGFWIRYLFFIGFNHVYIYDHGSTDGTVEYLRSTFPKDYVTVWDASNLHGVSGEDYLRRQSMQLTDSVYRLNRNKWVMNLDVDEFPVFFPNLQDFTASGREKVKSFLLPAVMFSGRKKGSSRLDPLRRFPTYSEIVAPYETLPLESVTQQRTKVLFQPKVMLCAFPHAVCSHHLDVMNEYVSVSKAYFSHFYDRSFPKPYNGKLTTYVSYYEKMEPYPFVEINKRLSDLVDLYCPVGVCTKNEKQLNDQVLWDLKMERVDSNGVVVKETDKKDLRSRIQYYHCPRDLLHKKSKKN